MASIIQSVLNSVRNKYQNIVDKFQDDKGLFQQGKLAIRQPEVVIDNPMFNNTGWFRQGKFTPIQNIFDRDSSDDKGFIRNNKFTPIQGTKDIVEPFVSHVKSGPEKLGQLTGKVFNMNADVRAAKKEGELSDARYYQQIAAAKKLKEKGDIDGYTRLMNSAFKMRSADLENINKKLDPVISEDKNTFNKELALSAYNTATLLPGVNKVKAMQYALGGTLGGITSSLQGEEFLPGVTKAMTQAKKSNLLLQFLNPIENTLVHKTLGNIASPVVKQVISRVMSGVINIGEDELLAKAAQENPSGYDRLLSFGIGVILNSSAGEPYDFKNLKKDLAEQWKQTGKLPEADKEIINKFTSVIKNGIDSYSKWSSSPEGLESQAGKIDFGAEIGGPKTKTVKTKGGLILNQEIEPKGDILPTQDKIVNSRGSGEVTEPNLLDKTTKSILGEQPKIEQPTKLDTEPLKDFSGKKIPTKQSQEIKQRVKELDSLNPVEKLVAALKKAKSVSPEQQKLTAAGRKKQYARISQARASVGGEKGYFAQLGAAKGEFDKVEFESLRNSLKQSDIDSLFNSVKDSQLSFWEKLNAGTGLEKLLGKKGGKLPTKGEIKLLDEVFGNEFTEALLSKRSLMMKLTDNMKDAINIPRALMASVDLSAPFRQGIFLVGHPKEFFSSFGSMIKSFGSEKAYNETLDNITQRPTYQLMRENKLAITKPDSKLSQGEESFMSNFAEKIPGVGTLVKASDRAYSGFLNKLRADVFDELFYKAKDLEIDTSGKVVEDIANFVNTATGRGQFMGPLKGLNKNAEIINGIFFSPKLMASRLNLLNPVYYAKLDPFVRKEAIKSLLTFAGTALTTVSLASLAGADVEKDPRSADFGKIKIGNTRYDTWGGFQQYIRLAAQFITGQTKSTGSGEIKTLGEGYKARTRWDIGSEFLQNKEAPVASFVTSLLKGQDNFGNKFNLPTEVLDRLIPMYIQDTYDLIKEWGPKGALMSVPGMLGVGSQTYGTQIPHMETNASGKPVVKFKNVGSMSEDIVSKLTGKPESNISPEQQKEYLKAREQEQKTLSFKNKVKKGEEKIDDTNFDDFYSYTKDGVVKFVDVGKFDSMPEQTAYQRALKEQKKFTLVDDILDNLKPEEQARALSDLGISGDDALYYNIAKQNNMMKSIYVEEEIRNLAGAGKSKDEIMEQLANWRIAINGKIILSNSVIDDLVDNKIISYQDGKLLKQIKEDGSFKQSGGSSAKKGKKISVSAPKITPIKAEYKPIKLQVSQKKVAKKSPQKLRVKLNFTTPKTLL